jgi:hypothetical protein
LLKEYYIDSLPETSDLIHPNVLVFVWYFDNLWAINTVINDVLSMNVWNISEWIACELAIKPVISSANRKHLLLASGMI